MVEKFKTYKHLSENLKTCVLLQLPVDSENIFVGPGGRAYGAWARGSAGPSASAAATDADKKPANR